MTPRRFIFLCCTCACLLLAAASKATSTDSEFALPSLLPKPTSCVFSGGFDQAKSLPGLDKPVVSQGVFFHHCKLGIIWRTTAPVENSMIVDAQQTAYEISKGKLRKVSGRAGKMIAQIISNLMSGNEEFILNDFSVTTVATIGEPTLVELTPLNKRLKRAIESIQLYPSSASEAGMKIVLRDSNEQVTTIIAEEDKTYSETLTKTECIALAGYSAQECDLLFTSAPD